MDDDDDKPPSEARPEARAAAGPAPGGGRDSARPVTSFLPGAVMLGAGADAGEAPGALDAADRAAPVPPPPSPPPPAEGAAGEVTMRDVTARLGGGTRPSLRLVDERPIGERTRPPSTALRCPTPWELYRLIPEIGSLTMQRPREDEDGLEFLLRLRASTTPEEAVTYTAFAALPERAAGWAYECLRSMAEYLNPMERPMLEMIAAWLANPHTPMRHRVMREALYAPSRSPSVLLGLAVGWSSGGPAPNDSLPAPAWRTPQAINSAVLSCLARADLNRRPVFLARFIDMAQSLFRDY